MSHSKRSKKLNTPLSIDQGKREMDSGPATDDNLKFVQPIMNDTILKLTNAEVMRHTIVKHPKVSISCKSIHIPSLLD